MPTKDQMIQFKYGIQSNYDKITTKDLNTVYFTTDSQRLFVGDTEYTRPIQHGTSLPTGFVPPNSFFYHETEKALYFSKDGEAWVACSNFYTHPSFTARTIGPAAGKTLTYGDTFTVPNLTVNTEGHVSDGKTVTFTLPAAPVIPEIPDIEITGDAPAAATQLAFGGEFTLIESDSATGHTITETKKKYKLPAAPTIPNITIDGTTPEQATQLAFGEEFTLIESDTVDTTDGHKIVETRKKYKLPDAPADIKNTSNTTGTGNAVTSVEFDAATGHVLTVKKDKSFVESVSLESGTNNGTLKLTVDGTATDNIAVRGLGSAAYTDADAYATAAQGDKADAAMPKAGGTFTGEVVLNADPTKDLGAATKQYVDSKTAALSGAMHFVGVSTTDPKGTTGATVAGHTKWAAGDVVLYGNKEFVLKDATNTADNWIELGDEGSHALRTITITGTDGLTGGGDLSVNRTIKHADKAATLSDVTAANATFVSSMTFDAYGHPTKVETTKLQFNTEYNATSNKAATMSDVQAAALVWGTF